MEPQNLHLPLDLAAVRPKKALLVGAYRLPMNKEVAAEQLEELRRLVETFGMEIVGSQICMLRSVTAATFIAQGKMQELMALADTLGADAIVFDDEISPAQQRNLEKVFRKVVMDRTEVILDVFANRAQTKEARLQIELARTKYQAPRLKRLWTHLSRQTGSGGGGSGGGAYLKGEGEKQIEIDRRLIKKKTEQLKREIEQVGAYRETQRSARGRSGVPVFAIVGYTNAGKSTLLNALTDADVLVEDKLFATLDTTTRKMSLRNGQEILLIDTVGFIRKLPHLLVAAFRSTLEESLQADILLHVIDASQPTALEQAKTTLDVLKELGAKDTSVLTLLNKVDACPDSKMLERLRLTFPKTVQISAKDRIGFEALETLMTDELASQRQCLKLKVPQSEYAVVANVMRHGHVLKQDYEDNDVYLVVELPSAVVGQVARYIQKE